MEAILMEAAVITMAVDTGVNKKEGMKVAQRSFLSLFSSSYSLLSAVLLYKRGEIADE